MSKKTLYYILGIILTAIIGAILNWLLCCPSGGEANIKTKSTIAPPTPVAIPETPKPTKNGLVFNDNSGDFNFRSNDNFNFNGSSFNILKPITGNLNEGITKLKSYFEVNPTKSIDVIGHYKSSESNPSAFPNLGIARANSVKNHLVELGIPSKNINLSSQLNNDLIPDDNVYYGPVTFNIITDTEDHSDELAELKAEIINNPLIVYFNTGDSNLNLSSSQRIKMQKISTYLDKVDSGKINVIGHTDNTGSTSKNISLSLARAKTVKEYLIQNGISTNKVNTTGLGPKKPIATNKTKDGRAKNRRVEVTLK